MDLSSQVRKFWPQEPPVGQSAYRCSHPKRAEGPRCGPVPGYEQGHTKQVERHSHQSSRSSPKEDTDLSSEIRLIHDLSYPRGISINDISERNQFPAIKYRHVAAVTELIETSTARHPEVPVHILKRDVKTAIRRLMMASSHVHRMGARLPQRNALVLDMTAAFGWTGSPSYYGAFGGAISWIVAAQAQLPFLVGRYLIPTHSYAKNGSMITSWLNQRS